MTDISCAPNTRREAVTLSSLKIGATLFFYPDSSIAYRRVKVRGSSQIHALNPKTQVVFPIHTLDTDMNVWVEAPERRVVLNPVRVEFVSRDDLRDGDHFFFPWLSTRFTYVNDGFTEGYVPSLYPRTVYHFTGTAASPSLQLRRYLPDRRGA